MGHKYFRPILIALTLIVFAFGCSGLTSSDDDDINISGTWAGYGGDASDNADKEVCISK